MASGRDVSEEALPSGQAPFSGSFVGTACVQDGWRGTVTFTVAPGELTEVMLVMSDGDAAEHTRVAEDGRIDFDPHAHRGGESIDAE